MLSGALFSRWRKARAEPTPSQQPADASLSSSQFSAKDILSSSICNVAGNYTEIEVKNVYPAWAAPQFNPVNRVTLPLRRQFVGREDLLTQLEERLQRAEGANVICLTGAAGVGKSALALEAAYRFAALFPDGCYWVDLRNNDAVKALRDLLSAMGMMNVEELGDDVFALAEIARGQLAGKHALLILDNAEGVVRRHRQQVLAMCPTAPAKTIITSRIMIDTDDIRVDVLNNDDALELLEAKGIVTAPQRDDALKLIRRLGNLALAIEIVARRMCITKPAQSCADSLREIEESASLMDTLKLPLGNMPDDSVAAAFALSYDLLDEQLRMAFHALGLCAPSGAPVQGIARMCDVAEPVARDLLRALAMLSLVEFDGKRAQLHPLLREYARARAHAHPAERNMLIVRHAAYFGGEIGSRYQQALNDEQDSLPALMQIDAESANVQLAQERALLPNFPAPELAVEITDYLTLYWRQRHINPQQLLHWIKQACKLAEQTKQRNNLANLLQAAGDVLAFCDRHGEALQSYQQALELFATIGDQLGQANALKAIGDVQAFRKENDSALQSYAQALELFTTVGDRLGQANALKAIGDVQAFRKENDAALQSYTQALELFTAVGDRLGRANALKGIGDVQAFRDQSDAALQSYNQALELFTAIGDRLGQAHALKAIGDLQAFRDQRDTALQSYERALELFTAIGDRLGQADTLKAIGDVHAFRKENDVALRAYDQALELFSVAGSKLGQANVLKAIGDVQAFRDQRYAARRSYERALELFTAAQSKLGQANTLKGLGDISVFCKENDAALTWYQQALDLFTAVGDRLGQANVLKAIGDLRISRGEDEPALQSYEQALDLFIAAGSKLGQAYTLQAIGDIQALQNRHDQALKLYEQALTLFTLVGSTLGQANAYVSLGHISGKRSCFDKAISLYASIHDAYSLARGKFYYALSLLDQDNAVARELLMDARSVWDRINFKEGVDAVDDLLSQLVSG
ncbi:MAG: tetratricopeptide repeat protein [Candidatus Brachytrichaceae bacterium NZ_4S206]